jgi:hypothetical protein
VPVELLIIRIDEEQTSRGRVVEFVGGACGSRAQLPARADFSSSASPFGAVAYLMMAIEGRDLQGTWRLVTGEALSREVYGEVHGVLGKFAKDVEEEGKRLGREEGRTARTPQAGKEITPMIRLYLKLLKGLQFFILFLFLDDKLVPTLNISHSQARNVIRYASTAILTFAFWMVCELLRCTGTS